MAGKYTPLENYLQNLPKSQREVTLDFEQIERILNNRLPPPAYEDRRWWNHETEGNHVRARASAKAGGQLLTGGLELHILREACCAFPL